MSKREAYEKATERWLHDDSREVSLDEMLAIRAYVTDLEQQLRDAHEALAVSAEMRADILERTAREAWDAAREIVGYVGDPDAPDVCEDLLWPTFDDWKRERGGK